MPRNLPPLPARAGRTIALVALAALSPTVTVPARGAGLFVAERGVRPLGRGAAFVAGADDGGAVAYNPAGLAFAGEALLVDASLVLYDATYQRKALLRQTDPNTGQPTGQEFVQTFPAVQASSPPLPIPTLVYSNPLGARDWNFALGVWAPYAAVTTYPSELRGGPAPQRYSLISLEGSALAVAGIYAAHRPSRAFAIGAGVDLLLGTFATEVAFSACVPDRFICAPEQPDYDAVTRLTVGPIVAPSGILGATLVPSDAVKIGASFRLPTWIASPATVRVRLPSAPVFESARQVGDQAEVSFRLPWILRAGVEGTLGTTRVEGALAYEAWSLHDEIVLENRTIELHGVEAFPAEYRIGDLALPRGFRDTWRVGFGVEHELPVGSSRVALRGGAYYERSAIPSTHVSVQTIDMDDVVPALGASVTTGSWRFDVVAARVVGLGVVSNPRTAAIDPVNPIAANPPEDPTAINGGKYAAGATVVGLGVAVNLGEPEAERRERRKRR